MKKVHVPGLGRLKAAFRLLGSRGFFAKLRAGWSATDAIISLPYGVNGCPLKYAVTIDQTHSILRDNPKAEGGVFWGVIDGNGTITSPAAVGWEILWALRECGLSAHWNGDCDAVVLFRLDGNPILEVTQPQPAPAPGE